MDDMHNLGEAAALRAILEALINSPMGQQLDLRCFKETHPTYYGWDWDRILREPEIFAIRAGLKTAHPSKP